MIILLLTPLVKGQECKAAFQITGRKPPPGQCNEGNDSECCALGRNYTAYWCSPPVNNRTEGVLNLSGFDAGEDGGGPSQCDGKYHADTTAVVAVSTGWYDFGNRCGQLINISGNGRSAVAAVVDECNSYSGCDAANSYQPPCPHNVLSASKAVWAALGVPKSSPLYGEMNVTWAPTNGKMDLAGGGSGRRKRVIIGALVAATTAAAAMVALTVLFINRKRRLWKELVADEESENSSEFLSGLPKRFTYNELKLATNNFDKRKLLGAGGFGSVFEGSLNDGTKVAIKRLNFIKQAGKKEFLTEVKTTGNTHHFNLVKLVGFCAEKEQHRLLVYEHMINNSLDKWIFRDHDNNPNHSLTWATRKKIILHIAKGLSYLHEDCQSKIIHLDVKPQNILLDREFNAKLADFGLAKLIDREESFAATQMRGTRGYLAPEWLSRKITEKVDVYSYGVVALEVVFQRRNLDVVQCEENPTVVEIVMEKMEEDERLFDAVRDWFAGDGEMMSNAEEVAKTIKLAIWCLQSEPTRRPSMSTVVKVLEGAASSSFPSSWEPSFDSTYKDSTAATTSGEMSSNATFEMSSMAFPR